MPLPAAIGLEIARMIHDSLFEKAESALESLRWRELTTDFIDVLDAILVGGAAVGGFGERFTRIAAAHAIHNGLSALAETAVHLHGTKVAYGIIVQKALEGNEIELRRLIVKFRSLGLPTSLGELGVDANDLAKIRTVVETTLKPGESIELLPFPVDERRLTEAIAAVETGNREISLFRGRFELSLDSSSL